MAASASAVIAETAKTPVQIGDPPPGKAQVVFYRKWAYPGALFSYIVREGKTGLGRLSAGTYFIAVVDPGLHTYTVRAERHDDMQIVVEAGETYYVRYELDVGVILYQPTLTPSEQRLFDQASARLSLSRALTSTEPSAAAVPGP